MRSSIRTRSMACLSMVLLAVVLVGAGDPGPSLDPGGVISASPSPQSSGALLDAHTPPLGSTAPVDDATWALVDRLTATTYTADTTAALVEALARSGIGTYAAPTSQDPETALTGLRSPSRLLDFQAHALAVGVWAHSTFTGAELDTVMPLPPDAVGMPTTSQLLAGYVATADSRGGALSRGLMAGQDLLTPTTARFPGVVLTLFASDIATDGGRLAVPTAEVRVTDAVATGICSAASAWIEGTITSLFESLKLATPDNLPGAIVVHIWNWLVDTAHAFVDSLISAASDAGRWAPSGASLAPWPRLPSRSRRSCRMRCAWWRAAIQVAPRSGSGRRPSRAPSPRRSPQATCPPGRQSWPTVRPRHAWPCRTSMPRASRSHGARSSPLRH